MAPDKVPSSASELRKRETVTIGARADPRRRIRFAKHALGWDTAALRHPEQVSRWTWLIIAAITQLRLARAIASDHRLPWERLRKPGRLTPGRVRRDFSRLLLITGTPASPPKPSKAGPGRPKGAQTAQLPGIQSSRSRLILELGDPWRLKRKLIRQL